MVRLLPVPHRVPVVVLRDDRLANFGRPLLPVSNFHKEMTRPERDVLVHETVLYEILLAVIVNVSERLLSLFIVPDRLEIARLVLQDRTHDSLVVRDPRDQLVVIHVRQIARTPTRLEL